MRAAAFAVLSITAALLTGEARADVEKAGTGRSQEPKARGDAALPDVLRVPVNDPRKGPRLDYAQGLPKCPDEKRFRDEVAYWLDGKDHLAADSPDVVRVRFRWRRNAYVGTVTYTDAGGKSETLTVTKEGEEHCLLLGRWVALKVAKRVPKKPPPEPCPTCPPCQACAACPPPTVCPACPAPPPPPKRPWNMDVKIAVSAYGMMSWLLTPNVAPAIGVSVEGRGEIFSVAGEIRSVLPSRVLVTEQVPGKPVGYPVEMDVSQHTALVVPCARWRYLVGCAVAQIGFFRLQTTIGGSDPLSVAVGPRVGFEVPFAQRFAVFGFAEALFSPYRANVFYILPPPNDPEAPAANVKWVQPVGSVFFGAGLSIKFE
jgi:hypothetical protein